MEGRNNYYGTWSAEGMGEKMKNLMPANYPSNGGWGKARHLMYFMQSAQNKGEFVMLAAGAKDHNCIYDYLNSPSFCPMHLMKYGSGIGKQLFLKQAEKLHSTKQTPFLPASKTWQFRSAFCGTMPERIQK